MPTPTISAPRLPSDSAPRNPPSSLDTIAIAVISASVSSAPASARCVSSTLLPVRTKKNGVRNASNGWVWCSIVSRCFVSEAVIPARNGALIGGDHPGEERADDRGESKLRRQERQAEAQRERKRQRRQRIDRRFEPVRLALHDLRAEKDDDGDEADRFGQDQGDLSQLQGFAALQRRDDAEQQ